MKWFLVYDLRVGGRDVRFVRHCASMKSALRFVKRKAVECHRNNQWVAFITITDDIKMLNRLAPEGLSIQTGGSTV